MKWSDGKSYYSLNQYYRELFGGKTYKIALDIGSTCPNRDGTLSSDGCIYCSEKGSGDFAQVLDISNLSAGIDRAILELKAKNYQGFYVAYLQSYTNTYGDPKKLMTLYTNILDNPRIKGLAIGTRPDCLSEDLLVHLQSLNSKKPIWIELGLQSIHPKTERFINRCYPLDTFEAALKRLHKHGLPVVVHLIAGLPSETLPDFLDSVRYISKQAVSGVKFHSLHVLKDTALGNLYERKPFPLPSMDAYIETIAKALTLLPSTMVIHRLTGDPPTTDLIAPTWSLKKRKTLNELHKLMKQQQLCQGQNFI